MVITRAGLTQLGALGKQLCGGPLDSFDYFNSLDDLENVVVAIGISTTQSLKAYLQCTFDLAAAILDLKLPVTSDS